MVIKAEKAVISLIIASMFFANAHPAERSKLKKEAVNTISEIIVRESKSAEKNLNLQYYKVDDELKGIKKGVRMSYQKSLLEGIVEIITLGKLLTPRSYREFSSLRDEISSKQNTILDKIWRNDTEHINEIILKEYIRQNVPKCELTGMYNKMFDLASEASKNEIDKHISKEKTIKEKEKAVFLLHAYAKGHLYIEEIYSQSSSSANMQQASK